MNIRLKKYIMSLGLIFIGLALLIITSLNLIKISGKKNNAVTRPWERFDRSLSEKTYDIDALYNSAEEKAPLPFNKMTPAEVMQVLYETTANRFTHGDTPVQHTLLSNWILFGLGKLYASFAYIYNPDILLANGHSAWCSQVSYILLCLAQKAGIRAREVGLCGHVVMEAWYEGDSHMYDSDLEVVVKDIDGSVLSVEELSLNADLVRREYSKLGNAHDIENVVSIITSREDNSFASYSMSRPWLGKSHKFEYVAQILKFIIPGVLIFLGLKMLLVARKKG